MGADIPFLAALLQDMAEQDKLINRHAPPLTQRNAEGAMGNRK